MKCKIMFPVPKSLTQILFGQVDFLTFTIKQVDDAILILSLCGGAEKCVHILGDDVRPNDGVN